MRLPISKIKSNPSNPRIIKDDKFKKLVQSLKDFPEMLEAREIVLNTDHIVLGGNMRLKAAKDAGITELPVKIVDWSQAKQDEFIIKDNASFGEWDWDELANQFDAQDLDDWGIDVPKDFLPVEVEEDEVPELSSEPPESVLGEIYQLGRHRVMCGDSTDAGNVALLMNGDKADMVFTDPPYGMFLNADYSDMKNNLDFAKDKGFTGGKKYDNVIGDHDDFNPEFINIIFDQFGYCKEIFMWGANYYSELLRNRNDGSWIVWDKRLDDSADKMYGSCFELCWSQAKHKQDIARVKWASVFGTEQEFDHKRHHPTQKPINLSSWFIEKYSEINDSIVDLFLGSGSTLIACEQTDRICYGMELDPKYVDVIRKRYWKFTHNNNEEGWKDGTPALG